MGYGSLARSAEKIRKRLYGHGKTPSRHPAHRRRLVEIGRADRPLFAQGHWVVDNSRLACELAMDALPMAIWRRRATSEVVIRCDQSMQYGSDGWRLCRGEHGLGVSMSRRSNY